MDASWIRRTRSFEVSDVADDRLVARWERHNAEVLIELACRVPAGRLFQAQEINVQLSQVHLAFVRGTAHAVVRDERMIASRPADAIAVYATLAGDALLDYDGGRTLLHPGQLLVCDVDRPFHRGFGHGLEELAMKVPRVAFTELTGLTTIDAPVVLDANANLYARALVRLVGRAVKARAPVPTDEQAILELVSVLAAAGRIGLPTAHRAAARAFIDDHLSDPFLSASEVAAGAGISERHLSRLFAEAGTSVPRHVLGRRLDLAYSLLSHGVGERTIDIAARCGFTSMAYFSQAFKGRFGATAGDVRHRTSTH